MLQIITGKFFTSEELYVTRQRGVLYTNYPLWDPIETVVGSLLPTQSRGGVGSQVYEVDEKLEAIAPDGRREFLKSVGGDYLIQDFAAVAAFSLNITCTLDLDLTRRLTQSTHPALGTYRLPREYVPRVFDAKIEFSGDDGAGLQAFLQDLVGLERRAYIAAMRAIRRYVSGLHRIGDDLDLAYSMLVASIESLAQGFDDFVPTWQDYDQNKRESIDRALHGAPLDTADQVRAAILKHEHAALARRYREFAIAHVQPSFFRDEAAGVTRPVRRSELPGALERAYRYRSKYVHTLRELPRPLTHVPIAGDTLWDEGAPALTLQGLARVARHVIHEFVKRGRKVDREVFDYRSELPNTVRMRIAERYWIWQSGGYDHQSARTYLGGFLSELASVLLREPDANLTDIRPVLEEVERRVPGLARPEQRLPMLTLYYLFHYHVSPAVHRPEWVHLIERYDTDFEAPSIESLLAHVLTGHDTGWTPDQMGQVRAQYLAQRYRKSGVTFPAVFEVAITLELAELYRNAGEEATARALIREAVEDLPDQTRLRSFEEEMPTPMPEIAWREILLPQRATDAPAGPADLEG